VPDFDAVVVGAGPNGLAAGIELARAGKRVIVYEAKETIGGGARTLELTRPGFLHDVCSAIHPLALGSPFFRSLPLEKFGVQWIQPEVALAHPFDDGTALQYMRSIDDTIAGFNAHDQKAYKRLMQPFVDRWDDLADDILGPLRIPPRHPILMARFGLKALQSASGLAGRVFDDARLRALFAGMAAHACIPLERTATASFGLVLGILGHVFGWPIPKGGSQSIMNAMAAYFESMGGQIITSHPVESLEQLPSAQAVLFDVTPRQLIKIAGEQLSPFYRVQLERYRYGTGVFKMDWALSGPIPWTAPECRQAGTVHLGATIEEIALSERAIWENKHPEKPYVLVAQQSIFDNTRAPEGQHTGWAYCHVPHGSNEDMSERITRQIERFAPGFRDLILETHTMTAVDMNVYNPNYIGGDINGGVQDIWQLFTRPTLSLLPYKTSAKNIYICSSSTPPGGGVHGMCGYHAARVALNQIFDK
jgi:phytoene dehydrogenase-like protein